MVACCRVGGTECSSICMGSSKEDPSYSLVAQMVKHLPAVWETWVRSLGWKDPKGPMHVLLHSVPPTLQQATTNPCLCWRLLDTHRQVWVSLSWSLLLSPGSWCAQGFVCALQVTKSLFPQSCVSSVIKSHWPPKPNSLGVVSLFARSQGWEICYGS